MFSQAQNDISPRNEINTNTTTNNISINEPININQNTSIFYCQHIECGRNFRNKEDQKVNCC